MSTVLKNDSNLYMYSFDSKTYDDIALAWYKTSGKFDKNSYGRWIQEKYRTLFIRASVDNSFVYLPTKHSVDSIIEELVGHLMLIAVDDIIKAVGVVINNIECPIDFLGCSRLIIVHILSTSNISLIQPIQFAQEDYLPMGVMKISEFIADKIGIGIENMSCTFQYERHILIAHAYGHFLNSILTFETPVKFLESERKRRIMALKYHLENKKSIQFPPMSSKSFSLEKIIKIYTKFT